MERTDQFDSAPELGGALKYMANPLGRTIQKTNKAIVSMMFAIPMFASCS